MVDEQGAPIVYATVYPEIAPEWGTATNGEGYFSFEANLTPEMKIIISFIGYEKLTIKAQDIFVSDDTIPSSFLLSIPSDRALGQRTFTLREQPIALQ